VSDKEMALLKGAVITDGDNLESAQKKIDNLKTFRDAIAKAIPLPGVQGKYAKGKEGKPAEGATQGKKVGSMQDFNAAMQRFKGDRKAVRKYFLDMGVTEFK